ncbi:MAG: Uma2 family endonuclease [Planctomycetia bacterium]|nr:Uma2 family endonuclease [Planctomycetia bacterium]
MATTNALLTAEEFAQLGSDQGPMELVRGQIMMMNVPGARHGYVCFNIAFELGDYLRKNPIGRVFCNDAGFVTHRDPDSVRGPDVSFYSFSRLPKGEVPKGYPAQPPELVFEVKSPSDTWKELHTKNGEYIQAGVAIVCIVDPEDEIVTIYSSDRSDVRLEGDAVFALPDLLPNFAVPIQRFFHAS